MYYTGLYLEYSHVHTVSMAIPITRKYLQLLRHIVRICSHLQCKITIPSRGHHALRLTKRADPFQDSPTGWWSWNVRLLGKGISKAISTCPLMSLKPLYPSIAARAHGGPSQKPLKSNSCPSLHGFYIIARVSQPLDSHADRAET